MKGKLSYNPRREAMISNLKLGLGLSLFPIGYYIFSMITINYYIPDFVDKNAEIKEINTRVSGVYEHTEESDSVLFKTNDYFIAPIGNFHKDDNVIIMKTNEGEVFDARHTK